MGKLYRRKGSEVKLIVVATNEEYVVAKKRFKGQEIIKTGCGGVNVLETLKKADKRKKIINFGYVGSNKIPVGTEVTIGECQLYHPNVDYEEKVYKLNGEVKCYTSTDFVTSSKELEPVVYDMELAYILSLGFRHVEAIKIVSDNLSLKEYEKNVQKECYKLLGEFRARISRQQFNTFKGQIKKGDIQGFRKGLFNLMKIKYIR